MESLASFAEKKCSPPWAWVMTAMVGVCSTHLGVFEASPEPSSSSSSSSSYQRKLAWGASRGFAVEFALCVYAIARHGVRRVASGRARKSRTVAFYCGFGAIPGERPTWDARDLKRGIGGSEQCVIRLARALARRGEFEVVVYNACGRRHVLEGVAYEPTIEFNPWAEYAHVVVWRLPQFLFAQRLAPTLRAASVTYWVHDGANLEMLRRGKFAFRRAIASAVRVATDVVFPSEEMLEAQRAALFGDGGADVRARTRAIPHGLPRFFGGSACERRDAWVLWPVSVERGLDVVLRRLDDLHAAAGPDFRLFVCHHRRGYHGATDAVADRRVVFTGMLPPAKLAAMYRRCSVFVFPSCVPEAFSLASWECMTHGVIPVAYGLGALASLADCGAPIVPPGDEPALFREARKILADKSHAARVRRYMLSRVETRARDWNAVAADWSRLVFRSPPIPVPDDDTPCLFDDEREDRWIQPLLVRHDQNFI